MTWRLAANYTFLFFSSFLFVSLSCNCGSCGIVRFFFFSFYWTFPPFSSRKKAAAGSQPSENVGHAVRAAAERAQFVVLLLFLLQRMAKFFRVTNKQKMDAAVRNFSGLSHDEFDSFRGKKKQNFVKKIFVGNVKRSWWVREENALTRRARVPM